MPAKRQSMKVVRPVIASNGGPFLPNEIGRIAQRVWKKGGRKGG